MKSVLVAFFALATVGQTVFGEEEKVKPALSLEQRVQAVEEELRRVKFNLYGLENLLDGWFRGEDAQQQLPTTTINEGDENEMGNGDMEKRDTRSYDQKRLKFTGSRGKRFGSEEEPDSPVKRGLAFYGSRGKKSADKRLTFLGSRGKKGLTFLGSRG